MLFLYICTKPFSLAKNEGKLFLVPKSSGPLLGRLPLKAFVAPLKKKSIPRLELLGCLAPARMYVTCVKALEFAKAQDWERFFWIDSSTVLSWIRTPPREFRTFVSARVAEIQETIGADQTVLGKGQFQIKAWHSNCSEIDQSGGERFTDLLGHKWDKEEDKFTFKKENVVGLLEGFSKRSCLKFLAQSLGPYRTCFARYYQVQN